MPIVEIDHAPRYRYGSPVGFMRHRPMLRPRGSHDLRMHEAPLTVEPAPGVTRWAHDVFGNTVALLDWGDDMCTTALPIRSKSTLTHFPATPALPEAVIDPVGETLRFSYAAREASGPQRPGETLRLASGRSGYLYDAEATEVVGSGAAHAWCAVYDPGAGWLEHDPTNGLVAGRSRVRVATTRPPEQAMPVGGVFIGADDAALGLEVDVRVTMPTTLPENSLPEPGE